LIGWSWLKLGEERAALDWQMPQYAEHVQVTQKTHACLSATGVKQLKTQAQVLPLQRSSHPRQALEMCFTVSRNSTAFTTNHVFWWFTLVHVLTF